MEDKPRICPSCNQPYTGYPAISRKDNKTEICSDCGLREALLSYYSNCTKNTR